MFKQEEFGYSKKDVEQYLVGILKRLEEFENKIEMQNEEIRSLEKRIEMLKTSDHSEGLSEKAKQQADQIIIDAILEITDLQNRVQQAIERELEK